MSLQSVAQLVFGFHPEKPIVVETSRAQLSSDAGLLPIRQFDEQIGFTQQFAAALRDTRDPALLIHTRLSMVVQRIYGILADYEDQNDHDTLPSDPVFKLLADRLPDALPAETLAGSRRRTDFNRRRKSDPLGEGHPCTWRTRLIKVAAEVLVSSRRVLVRLSSSWPHLDHFASVSQAILAFDTG